MDFDDISRRLGISRATLFRYRGRPDWPGDGVGFRSLAKWVKDHKGRRSRRRGGPSAETVPAPSGDIESGRTGELAGAELEQGPEHLPAEPGARDSGRICDALQAACQGRLSWLDTLTRKAGYGAAFTETLLLSAGELCALIGLNRSTLASWELKGLPEAGQIQGKKSYNLASVLQWIMSYHREQLSSVRETASRGLAEARRKNIEADSELKQQKLDERNGLLLNRLAVEEEFFRALSKFSNAFRGKPADWSVAVEGKTPDAIARHLDRELDKTFTELRQDLLDISSTGNVPVKATELLRAGYRLICEVAQDKSTGAGSDSAAAGNGDQAEHE